jgi:predicted DNA-binding protein with PD1-like motif
MAFVKTLKTSSMLMGKVSHGGDLLKELTDICRQNNVQLGKIEALGAVQKACVGYYNQDSREYEYNTLDKPLEITALTGNISLRDGEPVVHAHITLSDQQTGAFGGHLAPGTIVFACEFIIHILEGAKMERGFDEQTGLPLWEN